MWQSNSAKPSKSNRPEDFIFILSVSFTLPFLLYFIFFFHSLSRISLLPLLLLLSLELFRLSSIIALRDKGTAPKKIYVYIALSLSLYIEKE